MRKQNFIIIFFYKNWITPFVKYFLLSLVLEFFFFIFPIQQRTPRCWSVDIMAEWILYMENK